MRKFLLLVIFLLGCSQGLSQEYLGYKDDVFITPHTGAGVSYNFNTISLKVVNKRYREVQVHIICKSEISIFGEDTITLSPRTEKDIVIRGFKTPERNVISCEIVGVK